MPNKSPREIARGFNQLSKTSQKVITRLINAHYFLERAQCKVDARIASLRNRTRPDIQQGGNYEQ